MSSAAFEDATVVTFPECFQKRPRRRLSFSETVECCDARKARERVYAAGGTITAGISSRRWRTLSSEDILSSRRENERRSYNPERRLIRKVRTTYLNLKKHTDLIASFALYICAARCFSRASVVRLRICRGVAFITFSFNFARSKSNRSHVAVTI